MTAIRKLKYPENVFVLFGEPHANLRSGLRITLINQGFRNIRDVEQMADARDSVLMSEPDLVILDADMEREGDGNFIRDCRHGRMGKNPFIPILMTIWEPTEDMVRRIMFSGADGVLIKPFSPIQLMERIYALSVSRRPFIVSSDYIGPDRREDVTRPDTLPVFHVPNPLREKGMEISSRNNEAEKIDECKAEINREKIWRNAFQIEFIIQLIVPALLAQKEIRVLPNGLERLVAAAEDIVFRFPESKASILGSCRALMALAKKMQETPPSEIEAAEVDELKLLSRALLINFYQGESVERMREEVGAAVQKFMARGQG